MTGIHITHIVPPEHGWPIAVYCYLCKETTFVLSPYAVKPKDGDYWRMSQLCVSHEHQWHHNLQMAMKEIEKIPIGKCPIEVTESYWDSSVRPWKIDFQPLVPLPLPSMPSWVEYTQEMTIEEAKRRWPEEFED